MYDNSGMSCHLHLNGVEIMKSTHFLKDESGAVSVDFVVLTAAIVVLALTAIPPLFPAVEGVATDTADWLVDVVDHAKSYED